MPRILCAAAVLALSGLPSYSQPVGCLPKNCGTGYVLSSDSDARSYGILIAAPADGCPRVRYRVDSDVAGMLGRTPALQPGEMAVVRLGRGFSAGEHLLVIEAEGCVALPAGLRRVTLAKASPDHGWRASK